MSIDYICYSCGKKYSADSLVFRCTCGGMLDLDDFDISFSKGDILNNEFSLFRYHKALPFEENSHVWKDISMGEGLTPIVPLDPSIPNVLVKLDYLLPTLSFKDRGAAVLIAKMKELGAKKVIQDSSGNAGTSVAAYARRAGIECDIYVPESTPSKKVNQIKAHGATVHLVKGNRENTAKAALEAVENGEGVYASHVYNPYFYQGTKTYVYEIFEQLNGNMPEALVIPVGNGTLVLGAYYGLLDLLKLGLISTMPKIIVVQSENCAPIYKSFIENKDIVEEIIPKSTLAEGIAISNPRRGKQILEAVKNTNGFILSAPEDEFINTQKLLADKGFYVELTTAATFAGYFDYMKNTKSPITGTVVIPLCGTGLKSDISMS